MSERAAGSFGIRRPGWVDEFRAFIMRGNVVDLAVGIIIGVAFTGVVNSLVKDIFTPIIGLLIGGIDFTNIFVTLKGPSEATLADAQKAGAVTLNFGVFLNAVIQFLVVSFAVFWLIKVFDPAARPARTRRPPGRRAARCCSRRSATCWRPGRASIAASGAAGHLMAHVWPRPPLLRRQRVEARLLDPAGAAGPEYSRQLERRTDRGFAGRTLRRKGRPAQPRCDALGPRAVLGQGPQGPVRQHQRQGRRDRDEAGVS